MEVQLSFKTTNTDQLHQRMDDLRSPQSLLKNPIFFLDSSVADIQPMKQIN